MLTDQAARKEIPIGKLPKARTASRHSLERDVGLIKCLVLFPAQCKGRKKQMAAFKFSTCKSNDPAQATFSALPTVMCATCQATFFCTLRVPKQRTTTWHIHTLVMAWFYSQLRG